MSTGNKTARKKNEKKSKRARGTELRILLNVSLGHGAGFNSPVSVERIDAGIRSCIEKGWLKETGRRLPRYKLTNDGKEAAGLVLREVPLPPHRASLIKPGVRTS